MKGSARAGTVIAAPVNAEQRLLKVCASVADKKIVVHFSNRLARHCLPVGRDNTDTVLHKNKCQSKSDVIPKAALQQLRELCKTDINTFYVAIFGKANAKRMRQHWAHRTFRHLLKCYKRKPIFDFL
jgi:hypothetical protein